MSRAYDDRRAELEMIVQLIAEQIQTEMNDTTTGPPMGFLFMAFDFGDGGFCAHASNAQRADLVKVLREHADRLEAGLASTKGDA